MLPHDAIEYEALEPATLLQLATQTDEPYIATSALGELGRRRAPEAGSGCEAILREAHSDRHLRAFAITTLYDVERDRAIDWMTRLVEETRDPKVLAAMVECVLSDLDYFKAGVAPAFMRRLAGCIEAVAPDEFTDLDQRMSFLEIFSSQKGRHEG